MAEDRIIEGKLEPTERKPNPRGGVYLRAKIGNRHYSIFDPGEHAAFDNAIGKQVRIKVRDEYSEKDNKTYENYVAWSFKDLGDAPAEHGGGNGGAEMSKEEWELKDRIKHRTELAVACIGTWGGQNLDPMAADLWVDWVYKETKAPPAAPPFYGPEPVTNVPVGELGDEIDMSPIQSPNDFATRLRKFFSGVSLLTAAKEGGLNNAAEIGQQTNEKLTIIWQGLVAVRKPKVD